MEAMYMSLAMVGKDIIYIHIYVLSSYDRTRRWIFSQFGRFQNGKTEQYSFTEYFLTSSAHEKGNNSEKCSQI